MTKRLRVLLADSEFDEITLLARQRHATVAGWVREALRAARKLAAVEEAARHSYPIGDLDEVLAVIERGYLDGPTTCQHTAS
jgi:hypothetical protein